MAKLDPACPTTRFRGDHRTGHSLSAGAAHSIARCLFAPIRFGRARWICLADLESLQRRTGIDDACDGGLPPDWPALDSDSRGGRPARIAAYARSGRAIHHAAITIKFIGRG